MKKADTNFFAIKPELLEDYLNTLSLENSSKSQAFERKNSLKSACLCDVGAHWKECEKHNLIDFYFLHPIEKRPHVYDKEAVKKTLEAMQNLDLKKFDNNAGELELEAGFSGDSKLEFYIHVKELFEHALANDLNVVSYHAEPISTLF